MEDKVTERNEDSRNLGHEIPEGRKTSTANWARAHSGYSLVKTLVAFCLYLEDIKLEMHTLRKSERQIIE